MEVGKFQDEIIEIVLLIREDPNIIIYTF